MHFLQFYIRYALDALWFQLQRIVNMTNNVGAVWYNKLAHASIY
jgi:hypothetical protein